jgi:membrane protein implicated in regulation of membrane protease activity
MFREVMIKLAGATILLFGIGVLAIGFILFNKSMIATGFLSMIVAVVLLYYQWAISQNRPVELEPEENIPGTN